MSESNKNKQTLKKLTMWAVVVLGILMLPVLAKAPWTSMDFIFAGTVLFGSATVYELATRNTKNKKYRIAVGIGVLLFLIMVQAWAAA